jgi:6,7-dimethyl-8-ribityllumazine synthase
MNQLHTATPQSASPSTRVALVTSGWHREIVQRARHAATESLVGAGATVEHFEVPGAFEIPLFAKRLAGSGSYDAVIAIGLIVNGGIYRHEFVASAVIDGLMRVQLDSGVPVFSAVLTPRDFHEHEEHRTFFGEHLVKKGEEAAACCLATLRAHSALPR